MILSRDPNYRRLKVASRGAFGAASYWRGPEHLLVVEVASYLERYRRFYYRDIQALVIRQTTWHSTVNIVLGGIALFSLLGILIIAAAQDRTGWSSGAIAAAVFLGLIALAAAFGLFLNWRRGPTCACQIHTAVQAVNLPRITRWRNAQRLVDELTPAIMALQTMPLNSLGGAPTVMDAPIDPGGSRDV